MSEHQTHVSHGGDHPTGQGPLIIFIGDEKLIAPKEQMTGAELRNLPQPPVAGNRDLWLEVPGPADDLLIRPEITYEVRRGSHYYTAPSTINPGRS
jgi:hypothetical protein